MSIDLVLVGGTVIDGTGGPARRADVGIRYRHGNGLAGAVAIGGSDPPKSAGSGTIAAIGHFDPGPDATVIDATGLTVAPGFIDIHSHSDLTLLADPRAISAITQGVTLEVVGNCGYGCAPIINPALAHIAVYGALPGKRLARRSMADYFAQLEAAGPAVNVMALVPNGQLRLGHVGVSPTPATCADLDAMKASLRTALDEGAAGFSTGLEYAQEAGASMEEVTELCRIVATTGGLYATHTRNRDRHAVAAVEEAIGTARAAGVRLQVSHITPRTGIGATEAAIRLVEDARAAGLEVAFDMHTRTFGFTHLKNIVPPWMLEGSPAEILRRLRDPANAQSLRGHPNLISGVGDWDRVVLTGSRRVADMNGATLAEAGRRWNTDPLSAGIRILEADVESLLEPMVLLKTYDEEVLAATYRHPLCMIGSDATSLAPDGPLAGEIFHGAYTWAAWFYRRMVRELRILTPEAAIHRLTGLPARTLRLVDRGTLREGARADIIAFDAQRFGETGTVAQPNQLARGMRHVLVNGVRALADGVPTGLRGGQVLRARQ